MTRYAVHDLRRLAHDLLRDAGPEADKARATSVCLTAADMMGHATHGLGLLPWYLGHLRDGIVAKSGGVDVTSDRGAVIAWNGRRLPGAGLASPARNPDRPVRLPGQAGLARMRQAEADGLDL